MSYAMTLSDTQMLPKNLEAEEIFKWGHELGKCPFYKKVGTRGSDCRCPDCKRIRTATHGLFEWGTAQYRWQSFD